MKSRWFIGFGLMVAIFLSIGALSVQSQTNSPTNVTEAQAATGTAFTYQGYLDDNGTAANGNYDFKFTLYNALSGGTKIGNTITIANPGLALTDGIFTVQLDFGASAFTGAARYLKIEVRPANTGNYKTLSPRQELTAVPYAHGLTPGATISGSVAGGMLTLKNGTGSALWINSAGGNGVYVGTVSGNGMYVGNAAIDGVRVYHAASDGIDITNADGNGVLITKAGGSGVKINRAEGSGLSVLSASGNGLFVNDVGADGILINQAADDGVDINFASGDGIAVNGAGRHGLYVGSANADGVHVESVGTPTSTVCNGGNNGLEVCGTDGYGLYVGWANADGIRVESAGGYAGFFGGDVRVNGTTTTKILAITGGGDLSERFDISDTEAKLEPTPGMVVCIDADNPGALTICDSAYSRSVAGAVSGAGGINPGMIMEQSGSIAAGEYPVALTGRIYVQVDISYGAIQPGDLLTTSNTPGHAMKVTDYDQAQGAILGKAMTSLDSGTGLVLVLVTLQ